MEIVTTQAGATWGLDRIDQRDLPLNGTYNYTTTGVGVNAYIIDTGIRRTHTQFGGRAAAASTPSAAAAQRLQRPRHARRRHGRRLDLRRRQGGPARRRARAQLLAASGSNSGVIAGVELGHANQPPSSPAVANMSLGGGVSTALDTAVRNSIADGVTYAIAAGNSQRRTRATPRRRASPRRSPSAPRRAPTRGRRSRTSAACVDIFAPGSSITSAWYTSDTATNTISGTSMAPPHVAGVAALYLQNNRAASPATVRNAIVNAASLNQLSGLPIGTPNRLLFRSGTQ